MESQANVAMLDTMHQFALFLNQNWSTDVPTSDNMNTVHMQLHHRFGSTSYAPRPGKYGPGYSALSWSVEHKFPTFDIIVSISQEGKAEIRGTSRTVAQTEVKNMLLGKNNRNLTQE